MKDDIRNYQVPLRYVDMEQLKKITQTTTAAGALSYVVDSVLCACADTEETT